MAETVAELLVKVGADIEGLKKGSAEMNTLLQKLQADSDKAGGGFSRLQATTISLAAAVSLAKDAYRLFSGALTSVAGVAAEFASAASDQEDALLQLRNALSLTGNASDEVVKAFEAQADALQNQSRFADEAVNSVQALLTRFGVVPEDMAAATQAVADFASATGTDLTTAAEAVGRAVEGQARGLKAYGITLEDTGSKSQNLANAVAALNDRFGGSAAASVENMRGQIAVLSNAYGEIQETLGGFITQSDEGARIIAFVTDEINKLNTVLGEHGGSYSEIVDGALRAFVLAMIDATAVVISIGGAVETVGKKIAAFAGVLTLPFKSEGFQQAFADLTGTVETESDKMLVKLAEFRARFEAFGNDVPPSVEKVGAAVGALPPKMDAAGVATEGLAAKAPALIDASDRTAKALEAEKDALEKIGEALDAISFETSIAGFSDLGQAIAKEQEKIRLIGVEAKLSAEQIAAAMEEAAARVRASFEADLFANYKKNLQEIGVEQDIFAQITGRSATEQERLNKEVEFAQAKFDAAKQALLDAREKGFGPFSEEVLVATNNLRLANRELENTSAAAAAASANLAETSDAWAELGAHVEDFFKIGQTRSFQIGVAMEEVTAQLNEMIEAADPDALREFSDELEELAKATRAATSAGSPFETYLIKNANQLYAAAQQAENAARRYEILADSADSASRSVAGLAGSFSQLPSAATITFSVKATGSPTMDFSDYFPGYAETQIEKFNTRVAARPVVLGTNLGSVFAASTQAPTVSGNSADVRDEIRMLRHDVQAVAEANRMIGRAMASGAFVANLSSDLSDYTRSTR